MKGIKLSNHDTKLGKVKTSIPEYVYFEIGKKDEVVVKKNSSVKIGDILIKNNNHIITSSVSGKVISIDTEIKIKNDFKETEKKLNVTNLDKKKFIELLKESGLVGMSGAGFPTYQKYELDQIDYLVINAVECEPYVTADLVLCKEHAKEIVTGIKKICEINNIKEAIIVVKDYNNFFDNLDIKVKKVANKYPNGWERNVIYEALNVTYDKYPYEKNIVVNNVSTIFAITNLMNGKNIDGRIVTITDGEKTNNFYLKLGTKINELVKGDYIVGGPMMGIKNGEVNISLLTNGILQLPEVSDKKMPCLRCGKCIKICPQLLEPVLIKDNLNNVEKLKKLDVRKCIECGLCSYICPSKINLRDKVIEAKGKVK